MEDIRVLLKVVAFMVPVIYYSDMSVNRGTSVVGKNRGQNDFNEI
jgi:hypothetical protein